MSENCLFCKIVAGDIPAKKVYEDAEFVAFHDINPAAPVHLLLVPKHHVTSLQDITPEDAGWLGRMMALAPKLAAENGCNPGPDGGFRLSSTAVQKVVRKSAICTATFSGAPAPGKNVRHLPPEHEVNHG